MKVAKLTKFSVTHIKNIKIYDKKTFANSEKVRTFASRLLSKYVSV
jgi:hypothetical protein